MRVYLVPAEPEAANNLIRYAVTDAAADGSFALTQLAPGKYWMLARQLPEGEAPTRHRLPEAFDASARMGLRLEGEALKKTVVLSSCQRMNDFKLEYTPLSKPTSLSKPN